MYIIHIMYNTRISNLSMLGVGVGTGLNSVERSNRKIHEVENFKIWYHKVTIQTTPYSEYKHLLSMGGIYNLIAIT